MKHDEYISHDATALAERVRAGDVTATELLEIALSRIDSLNPRLNTVVRLMDDARDAAAREGRGAAVLAGIGGGGAAPGIEVAAGASRQLGGASRPLWQEGR